MAHTKFKAELLTPEGEVFNGEVEMIATKTTLGEIAILAGHEPLLATLEPTELRLYRSDTEIVALAQSEGYLQVTEDGALLLVEEAVDAASLTSGYLQERLADAQARLEGAPADSERARLAKAAVKRWQKFISLAEKS